MMIGRWMAGLAIAALASGAAQAAQPSFPSAEAAMAAFGQAVQAPDSEPALLALFGPEHADELLGGDPATRRVEIRRVAAAAADGMALRAQAPDQQMILLGRQAWPMPIPLVREAAGWRFDTKAGLEILIDERIGKNELAAIATLDAYVDAQLLYAAEDRDGDLVLEYAQKIASSPGKHNGLYWVAAPGEAESPLGPLLAAAGEVGQERHQGEPFFGYHFKILTRQGAHPPGGAYDYVINGNMIGGFAMVAWPADHGNSGIMTFVVNQRGEVLQKDLGKETAKLAQAMTVYDPDQSWVPAED